MATPSNSRFGPAAYIVGAVIAVTGGLVTLGIAAADRTSAAERFDAVASSTAFAIESELDSIVHVLHGARSLLEVRPDLSHADFVHYLEEAHPVAGVIGWGLIDVQDDAYLVDHFHSEDPDIRWTGTDLATRRETRDPIDRAISTHQLTATNFAPMPGLPARAALLINPHQEHEGGPAFAIISAEVLATELPPELTEQVAVSIEQSTQLAPRDVAFRGVRIGFGNRMWALSVTARSPDLYPSPYVVPLGVLITTAGVLLGMLVSSGITQRRRLRAEVVDNDRINEAREQFIASVSHEIRTPLTAVVGYAEVLQQQWTELTTDEAWDMVTQIAEQSMEVSALVKDLLVGSRADISSLHLDYAVVPVREVTERALASIPGDMRRNIDIGFADDRAWMTDPGRASQIVRNLVVNALKYGGDSVTVESRRLPGSIILSVVDDGEGVTPEEAERIFQPFASVARSSQALPSVGLGLYVSLSLARAMGGDLTYRRHNGLTAFDLELPEARIDSLSPAPAV